MWYVYIEWNITQQIIRFKISNAFTHFTKKLSQPNNAPLHAKASEIQKEYVPSSKTNFNSKTSLKYSADTL